jgi:hypothetical protein
LFDRPKPTAGCSTIGRRRICNQNGHFIRCVQSSSLQAYDDIHQVHPLVLVLFPNNDATFQENDSPIHTEVFSLRLRSMKMHLTSSLASTLTQLKYHRITVASFREQGDKQIPSIISQATRIVVVQYSTRDYSEFTRVYCKDTSCVTGKCWPNSILTLNLLN